MRKKKEKPSTSGSSKARIGKRSRQRGHEYERKIVNELKEITGNDSIKSSRQESKSLDDNKIDVFDGDKVLPCYFQIKCTQATPQIKKINEEVGLKDKPLCILWNAQEPKEKKQVSVGEYAIIPKSFFYELLKQLY